MVRKSNDHNPAVRESIFLAKGFKLSMLTADKIQTKIKINRASNRQKGM